jgi:hypothetical protein
MKKIIPVLLVFGAYIGLVYWGGETGKLILYPIIILVTILHELGHAFFALVTGGTVYSIAVDPFDGSGVTSTSGGISSLIIMGGYIGSAFFGNLLFGIGAYRIHWSKTCMWCLAILMIFTGFVWYSSLITTGALCVYAIGFYLMSKHHHVASIMLMFLGLASIAYIIQDFNGGPHEDLIKFTGILPTVVWSYIWLGIVCVITFYNLRMLVRHVRTP